jgi:ribonuclease HI
MNLIVTINTDASYSNKHKVGTYAFWIFSDRFKIKKAGVLKKSAPNPTIAEFRCIINAFTTVFMQDLGDVKKIVLNTDSLNCIHLIAGNKKLIKRYGLHFGAPYVQKLTELRLQSKTISQIPIELKHVKAHTMAKDGRSFVNEWCDTEAKKWMSKTLKVLENEIRPKS